MYCVHLGKLVAVAEAEVPDTEAAEPVAGFGTGVAAKAVVAADRVPLAD